MSCLSKSYRILTYWISSVALWSVHLSLTGSHVTSTYWYYTWDVGSQTCCLLYRIVQDTPLLQYNISLDLAGFQDCCITSELSTVKRLAELKTLRDNWTKLRFRKRLTFHMPQIIRVWELAGGVMAYGLIENQISIPRGLGFVELPSIALGTPGRSWRLSDLGIYIRAFSMNPSHDLLVVGSIEPFVVLSWSHQNNWAMQIYLLSMSIGETHPSATSNPLKCPFSTFPEILGLRPALSYKYLLDDVVGILVYPMVVRRNKRLLICNWKSDTLLIVRRTARSSQMYFTPLSGLRKPLRASYLSLFYLINIFFCRWLTLWVGCFFLANISIPWPRSFAFRAHAPNCANIYVP